MYYYKCVRCNHITKQKIEIQRHINRKFKCKNTNKYEGTDKDFIIASLIKIFTEENVEELKKENDLKEQINNNETFICTTCNLVFEDKLLYNKHVKNICQNHTTNITNMHSIHKPNNIPCMYSCSFMTVLRILIGNIRTLSIRIQKMPFARA